jgi:hypothetical protein
MVLFEGKRGQVCIFVAILLIAFAFSVARPSTAQPPKGDAFTQLHENFARESPVVVNSALYQGSNVSAKFASFAGEYFNYARGKSPGFRFLYILRDNDALVIGNYLGLAVNASFAGASYNVSHDSAITVTPADVTIYVDGIGYAFDITGEPYLVRSLFRQQNNVERRVFVSG